jgi:hypothetical protein
MFDERNPDQVAAHSTKVDDVWKPPPAITIHLSGAAAKAKKLASRIPRRTVNPNREIAHRNNLESL